MASILGTDTHACRLMGLRTWHNPLPPTTMLSGTVVVLKQSIYFNNLVNIISFTSVKGEFISSCQDFQTLD